MDVCIQPVDDSAPLKALFASISQSDLELALERVVDEAVEEVMNSTNLQPSIPGIVCEVISDIVQSVSEAGDAAASDALNGNAASKPPSVKLVRHNTQVC